MKLKLEFSSGHSKGPSGRAVLLAALHLLGTAAAIAAALLK